ncbi:endo alpha-1,4 polygalactosaminidase [Nonomuraea candida]|uniref:endo alpha-1,4 polygalactosaminidase n=1 Tax=Nonomuraea candida TaxID=359159 RepID=UPI0012F7898F|nr:endo alpha-1,4 polygalactosaminidase [Nonomuraea candida]
MGVIRRVLARSAAVAAALALTPAAAVTTAGPATAQSATAQSAATQESAARASTAQASAAQSAATQASAAQPSAARSAVGSAAKDAAESAAEGAALWRPPLQSRWQYQLEGNPQHAATGGIDVDVCAVPHTGGACVRPTVFDIDLYVDSELAGNNSTVNTAAVKAIHARGAKAICYVDAGSIEDFRPDYRQFLDWHKSHGGSLLGKPFSADFPNERWANINNDRGQRDFLLKMMAARVDKCARAGFDGVEFDVVNAYEEGKKVTGWTVSAATQLAYNRALAKLAHDRGLSVALKNDTGQAAELVSSFDYAVNESCFQWDECAELDVFVKAGKPVFHVEYATAPASFCSRANKLGFNSIKKPADLSLRDKPFKPCR